MVTQTLLLDFYLKNPAFQFSISSGNPAMHGRRFGRDAVIRLGHHATSSEIALLAIIPSTVTLDLYFIDKSLS